MSDELSRLGAVVGAAQDRALELRVLPPLIVERAPRGGGVRLAVGALGGAALVTAVALLLFVVPARRTPSVAAPAGLAMGSWSKGDTIVLSDGTRATPERGARLRLRALDAGIAIFELQRGVAVFDTAATQRARVRVEAGLHSLELGPAPVALSVNYDVVTGLLAVQARGTVTLDGAPLASGRRMVVSEDGQVIEPPPPAPAPAQPLPTLTPPVPSTAARRPASAAPAPAPLQVDTPAIAGPTWQEQARAGRHADAIYAARALGIEAVVAAASREDLTLLGTSARLAPDVDAARRAFTALRARFAGALDARRATFFLARIAADVDKDDGAARALLEEYLAGGADSYELEAHGRLIEILVRAGDGNALHLRCASYLAEHPTGPYVGACQTRLPGEGDK